jgi:4-hydroxybenzoate polyprenyltransferase
MNTSADMGGPRGRVGSRGRYGLRGVGRYLGLVLEHFLRYWRLMRLDRPIGAWLLLWPTLWGLWIAAAGRPDEHVFLVMMAGAVLVWSTSCVINDLAGRRRRQPSDRPLATGEVTRAEALIVFIGLMLIGVGLVLTLNPVAQLFALGGATLFIVYPFAKRLISVPQFVLGITFAWGVPMAFASQLGEVPRVGWLLFVAAIIWVITYDTQYAMVERDDDAESGARSSAILFGDLDRLFVAGLHILLLVTLVLVGQNAELGVWYFGGLGGAGVLALYQQYLIRHREPDACFDAFLNNAWFGGVVFVGLALDYLFRT